ncbi:MAG: hypothetical protein WBI17_06855 [Clostridiaceae bacterium]
MVKIVVLWNKEEVLHNGWNYVGMIDLGENIDDMKVETSKTELNEICEMCNQEGIQYVHLMEHPLDPEQLRVGCDCASKMKESYKWAHLRENRLKNLHKRKINFSKLEWKISAKGYWMLKYNGKRITIMKSKSHQYEYVIVYKNQLISKYMGKKILDLEIAKIASFDLLVVSG